MVWDGLCRPFISLPIQCLPVCGCAVIICQGCLQVLREMFFRAPSLGSKGLNRGIVTGKNKPPFFVSLMLQVAIIGVHWVCVPVQSA